MSKSEIVALDRNGDRLNCATKVCGNGQQSPLVVISLEAPGAGSRRCGSHRGEADKACPR
jgi:hypothetical protein